MIAIVRRVDAAAFYAVQTLRRPGGVAFARVVSALGEPAVVYPLLLVVGLRTANAASRQSVAAHLFRMLLVVASGAAARRVLSQRIARPRPPRGAWLVEPEGYSMPSKHTTLAALSVGAWVRSTNLRGSPRWLGPGVAAGAVGTSRVWLGVHWPSDVVAGWLFAEAWLRLADLTCPISPRRA
jgi:membrane-associated phospholipid phosphatase